MVLEVGFNVQIVDEFKTSKTCNVCFNDLETYKKRNGKNSYTRLCCTNCPLPTDREKRFVNRDVNAAANILLAGMVD